MITTQFIVAYAECDNTGIFVIHPLCACCSANTRIDVIWLCAYCPWLCSFLLVVTQSILMDCSRDLHSSLPARRLKLSRGEWCQNGAKLVMSCKKGFRKFVLCNFRQISRLPSEKCLLQPSIRHCCQAPCEVVYPFLGEISSDLYRAQKIFFFPFNFGQKKITSLKYVCQQ